MTINSLAKSNARELIRPLFKFKKKFNILQILLMFKYVNLKPQIFSIKFQN